MVWYFIGIIGGLKRIDGLMVVVVMLMVDGKIGQSVGCRRWNGSDI